MIVPEAKTELEQEQLSGDLDWDRWAESYVTIGDTLRHLQGDARPVEQIEAESKAVLWKKSADYWRTHCSETVALCMQLWIELEKLVAQGAKPSGLESLSSWVEQQEVELIRRDYKALDTLPPDDRRYEQAVGLGRALMLQDLKAYIKSLSE